jgi:nucleoside phosphorylase
MDAVNRPPSRHVVSGAAKPARGLILIIVDTLRTDFFELAGKLPNFQRLRDLCSIFPGARCGSFPTGPMRTDLLTGRLSFLDERWAVPERNEVTLTRALRDAGVRTTLVTDNYVAVCPQIGGMLLPEFDSFDFIRGAGSDPWQTPSASLCALPREVPGRPPSRSVDFEIQYMANVAAWQEAGGPPTSRLFVSAAKQLALMQQHERFLVWVDSFGCHEPWDTEVSENPSALPELPLFPGYVEKGRFDEKHINTWRTQYIQRIRNLDLEFGRIIDEVERHVASGQVALAVLSDHGFLFGEYGFVGKPANTPLPPELHEIICWLSPHFEATMPRNGSELQPHTIHGMIRHLFGLETCGPPDPGLHVFGRNSPRSDYLAATAGGELYVASKAGEAAVFGAVRRAELQPARTLMEQAVNPLSEEIGKRLQGVLRRGKSPWLAPFVRGLEQHLAAENTEAQPPRNVDALVVCALDVEVLALQSILGGTVRHARDPRLKFWHFFTRVGSLDVAVVQLGAPWAGNVVSCGATASMLPLLDPWLVVTFGIAASLDPAEVPLCDVVFARSISYIDLRKETESAPWVMKQIPQLMTRPELLNVLMGLKTERVHKVDIVSSEVVVKSVTAMRKQVAKQAVADAKVAEMEAFGVYKACELDEQYLSGTKRYCVAIKGISDDGTANKDDTRHHESSTLAAVFLRSVLESPETLALRASSSVESRPMPFRPLSIEKDADRAATQFLEAIRPALGNEKPPAELLHAIHLRHSRPRVFYHWRLAADGIHWVDLHYLRVFRRLRDLGYPVECLVTDRRDGAETEAELESWRETTLLLVRGVLDGLGHVTFYQEVVRREKELALFSTNAEPPPNARPNANTNLQLNLWLRYIAWRSRIDGTCFIFHRPGAEPVYSLLWHFGDLIPGLIRTRSLDLGKTGGKFDQPGKSFVLKPDSYDAAVQWLKNPPIDTKDDTPPIEILKQLRDHLAFERESAARTDVTPLGVPAEWLAAYRNGDSDSDLFFKGAIAHELAKLTAVFWTGGK